MDNLARKTFTESEYLELERNADFKSEYYNGEIFAMAGATLIHNKIVSNLIFLFNQFLKDKPCEVYPSDLRLQDRKIGTLYLSRYYNCLR
jgi:Uma2 family endonuclease